MSCFISGSFSSFLISYVLSILNCIQLSIFCIISLGWDSFSLINLFLRTSSFSNLLFWSIVPSIENLLLSCDSFSKIGFSFSIALILKLFPDSIEIFLNVWWIFFLYTFFVDIFISLSWGGLFSPSIFTSSFLLINVSSFGLLISISSFFNLSTLFSSFNKLFLFSYILSILNCIQLSTLLSIKGFFWIFLNFCWFSSNKISSLLGTLSFSKSFPLFNTVLPNFLVLLIYIWFSLVIIFLISFSGLFFPSIIICIFLSSLYTIGTFSSLSISIVNDCISNFSGLFIFINVNSSFKIGIKIFSVLFFSFISIFNSFEIDWHSFSNFLFLFDFNSIVLILFIIKLLSLSFLFSFFKISFNKDFMFLFDFNNKSKSFISIFSFWPNSIFFILFITKFFHSLSLWILSSINELLFLDRAGSLDLFSSSFNSMFLFLFITKLFHSFSFWIFFSVSLLSFSFNSDIFDLI